MGGKASRGVKLTYYLIVYLAYSCPIGFMQGMIPKSVLPIVCEQTTEAELIAGRKEAYKKAEEMALKERAPKLYWCKGLKCREREISVTKSVEIR